MGAPAWRWALRAARLSVGGGRAVTAPRRDTGRGPSAAFADSAVSEAWALRRAPGPPRGGRGAGTAAPAAEGRAGWLCAWREGRRGPGLSAAQQRVCGEGIGWLQGVGGAGWCGAADGPSRGRWVSARFTPGAESVLRGQWAVARTAGGAKIVPAGSRWDAAGGDAGSCLVVRTSLCPSCCGGPAEWRTAVGYLWLWQKGLKPGNRRLRGRLRHGPGKGASAPGAPPPVPFAVFAVVLEAAVT